MRIQILSDLHIDTYAKRLHEIGEIPETTADIILVAGDTCNSHDGMPWLQQQANRLNKPIFTIAGNHEYFDEDIMSFDAKLADWDSYKPVDSAVTSNDDTNINNNHSDVVHYGTGLKFMQCNTIDLGDIRLLACTLWTDFEYQATPETFANVLEFMRDYKRIKVGEGFFSPQISVQIHQYQRYWLKQALIEAYKSHKKVVVMTHHSVSPKSVSDKYASLPSNAAFVSDLSSWMLADWAPKLWVHGHTHEAFDYQIGQTRVVVNPRAYPGELSSTSLQFDWSKVVEI